MISNHVMLNVILKSSKDSHKLCEVADKQDWRDRQEDGKKVKARKFSKLTKLQLKKPTNVMLNVMGSQI